ncbi:unnamed protein product [Eruca vesicaria subsp. sativa]|uniref:ATP-diphosphatase n=1 Tax=Eruca vesicaria subsp. sativa TaxID=29727 RepID=A0ABC8LCW1_ERUVS|nr:unnamed protein product [Eruca vesicaria subsp. sativa]
MEESTAASADTLRMELKKTVTEILDGGGGVSEDRGESDGTSGVLKSIDEAIRILNRLREVESKMQGDSETSSSSSVPQVPKEFKCMLSHAIMSEPVVIASGQTYEKRYIQQWLMFKETCPKTKEVLSHRSWSPNHLIDELITQWCQANKYDRPEASYAPIGLFSDDIDLLLQRISSPSSVEDQIKAASELRRQTKRFENVPALFVTEIPESITRLLTPLSALGEAIDSNRGLQKDIITALLYISSLEENKTAVAQHPLVIPLLTKSLKKGTAKTRRNSAEALWELSKVDSNKRIIGDADTLKALIHVIKEDHFTAAVTACYAVFHLCDLPENRGKVVSEGLIPTLINRIKERSFVYIYFALLALMTAQDRVIEEIEDLGFVDGVFSILRNTSCSVTGENGTLVVLRMCGRKTGDRDRERTRMKLIKEEEDNYSTFSKLAKQGSKRARIEAKAILQWIKRSGTESTAEATKTTADALKPELKKLLTEILSNGGGEIKDGGESDGVLKAIDDANKLLNRLREAESKKPESDIPSSSSSQSPKVEVPKEFICILSNKIMIEPVTIASGETYEYLKNENICPKSKEVLSHSLCTPNHLLDELITKWCLTNGYDRPKPADEVVVVTELSNDGIESLLQRISSPSSDEDQLEAAKEIRCQTNKFPNVRDRFVALHPGGITMLIRPLSDLDIGRVSTKPELQENLITALFNISIVMENVEAIAQTDKVISILTTSLTSGTMETRRNSASALLSLLAIASNKELIGSEETFTALGQLILAGDPVTSLVAGSVVYHLCHESDYMEKAISAGMVQALMRKIREGRYAAQYLGVLALLTTQERGVLEMEENREFMRHLFGILRGRNCLRSCENAVVIVLNMCSLVKPRHTLKVVNLEENEYATFLILTKQESSESLARNAGAVLQWLKVHGTGVTISPAIVKANNVFCLYPSLKYKYRSRRRRSFNKVKSKLYLSDQFALTNPSSDLEPLQDPPQTTASSGTGNGKIRYRSPSATELMESGTATVSSSVHHSPSNSSESHQGLLSVDGGKMTTTAKRGIGRHESIADKIQRNRGILLVISIPILLIGLVLLLMPGRSTSDAVVEEYTVLNRKGGPNSRPPKNYAVIFDAGSSGSRVHVYCFDRNLDLLPLGNELELFLQLKPGLSAYPTDPRQAANSLVSLLDKAEASVPRELRPKTPVRVGATAGLRTLGHKASENILQAVKELLRDRSMLKTEANAVTVLDGTQEGSYQWVTINYLLRNLGKPYSDTVGVVDLGGGSVQMAYAISEEDAATAPKPLEGEDSYVREMYLKGRKYFLYVHSYLHYGLLAARAEILKVSEDSNNPCIVTGYDGNYKYGGEELKAAAVQSGASLNECRRLTINALKVNDTLCTHMKCTFGGVWNGGRGGGQKNMFVASFFFDRAAEAGFVDPKQPVATVRPIDFEKAAKKACSMKMEEGKSKFPRVEEDNLPYLCMDLVYQYTLLVNGFGLEPSQTITLVKKVKYGEHAVEAAWPLGSAIEAVSSP